MAYCVHCGVKLGEGEKRCPLCGTEIIDPAAPAASADVPRAYPVRTPEQELKRNRRYLLTLSAVLLLAPAFLCLLIDLLTSGGIQWSLYAAGALVLLFISVAVPLLLTRHRVSLSILASFLCLNAYLFMTERISGGDWFFPIVLPALTVGTAMLLFLTVMYRRDHLNKLTLLAASLSAVAVQCLLVEWLVSRARAAENTFVWSPYVVAPCVFISLLLFFINGSRPIREEVRRRVHF